MVSRSANVDAILDFKFSEIVENITLNSPSASPVMKKPEQSICSHHYLLYLYWQAIMLHLFDVHIKCFKQFIFSSVERNPASEDFLTAQTSMNLLNFFLVKGKLMPGTAGYLRKFSYHLQVT